MNSTNNSDLHTFLNRTVKDLSPVVWRKDEEGFPTKFGPGSTSARVALRELVRSVNSTTAGDLIPSGHVQSAAAPLGQQAFLSDLGAVFIQTILPGAEELPFFTSDPAVVWINEEEDTAVSDEGEVGLRPITPHTVRCHTEISRRLRKVSKQVEGTMADAILRSMRKAVQAAAIGGSGANNEPMGLINATGMTAIDAGLSFSETLFADAVESIEISGGDARYFGVIAHPTTKKKLSSVQYNNGVFWRAEPASPTKQTAGGFAAASSTDVPEGRLIVGDFSQLLIIHNDAVDMTAVTQGETFGKKGSKGIFAFLDVDVVVRHPDAFTVINNV